MSEYAAVYDTGEDHRRNDQGPVQARVATVVKGVEVKPGDLVVREGELRSRSGTAHAGP